MQNAKFKIQKSKCRVAEAGEHCSLCILHFAFPPLHFLLLTPSLFPSKITLVPRKDHPNFSPRITNRRAMHEYFIAAKIECGIALVGSEVKSLRHGKAQLAESFARIENGELILHNCHIDPYEQASILNHEPKRSRRLLVHRREIRKLEGETTQRGTALTPLAI